MSLHASASWLNIKKSLETYLEAALAGSGLAIDWPGLSQPLGGADKILRPRMEIEAESYMGKSPTNMAVEWSGRLGLELLVRPTTDAGGLAAARDAVLAVCRPGGRLPVYDHGGASPSLSGHLVIDRLAADRELAARDGYLRREVVLRIRLAGQWT